MTEFILFLNVFVVEMTKKFELTISNEAMINLILLLILFALMSVIYGTIMALLNLMESIGAKRFKKYQMKRVTLDKLS